MIQDLFPKHDLIVLSIVFCAAESVYDHLDKIIRDVAPSSWTRLNGIYSLDDCFTGYPPPGAAHKLRVLAFSPQPHAFSFITANLEDGWSSLTFRLTTELQCKALILGFSNDQIAHPARFFSWVDRGVLTRHVSVRLEDKWLFYQQGVPLPQENKAAYGERLIKLRL